MIVVELVEFVESLDAADPAALDRDGVLASLSSVARVRSWLDAKQAVLIRRLSDLAEQSPGAPIETDIAAAMRGSRSDADRAAKRAAALGVLPEFEEAFADGEVSGAHIDVLTRALQHLTPEHRLALVAQASRLRAIAARSTPEHFAKVIRHEIHRIDQRASEAQLARQRRSIGVRWWIDPDTGMWCIRGEFDPETGLAMQGSIETAVESLFHATVPDTCPVGDGKQDHLRALALAALTQRRPPDSGTGADSETSAGTDRGDISRRHIDDTDNRFEICIIIDLETLQRGLHEHSIVDNGSLADIPVESYRRMACTAAIIPIVLNSAGVVVDQGRQIRLANRAQRRALRTMYETCAIPDCGVRSKHCEPHHIAWWQNGGATDLHNLLPLCSKHHHNVHEDRWKLDMHADRAFTITYPDGHAQTTGPPATARAA